MSFFSVTVTSTDAIAAIAAISQLICGLIAITLLVIYASQDSEATSPSSARNRSSRSSPPKAASPPRSFDNWVPLPQASAGRRRDEDSWERMDRVRHTSRAKTEALMDLRLREERPVFPYAIESLIFEARYPTIFVEETVNEFIVVAPPPPKPVAAAKRAPKHLHHLAAKHAWVGRRQRGGYVPHARRDFGEGHRVDTRSGRKNNTHHTLPDLVPDFGSDVDSDEEELCSRLEHLALEDPVEEITVGMEQMTIEDYAMDVDTNYDPNAMDVDPVYDPYAMEIC
ncbi:hypothetical protein ONZ45_g5422 [Pleurotus djamor]|nr:hypothetical protein ONZ45_g5422 [Pleurotus djamor]